ncbi:MAG: HNH endonuclease [Rhizobiales bacterium]|nr:HNH endonuclease [Hyphomicrobiales bacterium]
MSKSKRVRPPAPMRERLLSRNAHRCCVCKASGVGLELHHVDGDPSNTTDANMAVLCVTDHDRHHRASAYRAVNHMELTAAAIGGCKLSWEAFVAEARTTNPRVLATVTTYGTAEYAHAAELVMQWPHRMEYRKVYHARDGDMDRWSDEILREVTEVGRNIGIAFISKVMPDQHCPSCGAGLSNYVKPSVAVRMTHPRWHADSACGIFVHPDRPAIEMAIGTATDTVFEAWVCLRRGTHIHVDTTERVERIALRRRPSARTQARIVIERMIRDWRPGRILIATRSSENPRWMSDLDLPACWEHGMRR